MNDRHSVSDVAKLQRRVRIYLRDRHMSVTVFAKQADTSYSAVRTLLAGGRPWDANLRAIEQYLDLVESDPGQPVVTAGVGVNTQANKLDVTILEPDLEPEPGKVKTFSVEALAWHDEITALRACWAALEPLEDRARYRVLGYLQTKAQDLWRDDAPAKG